MFLTLAFFAYPRVTLQQQSLSVKYFLPPYPFNQIIPKNVVQRICIHCFLSHFYSNTTKRCVEQDSSNIRWPLTYILVTKFTFNLPVKQLCSSMPQHKYYCPTWELRWFWLSFRRVKSKAWRAQRYVNSLETFPACVVVIGLYQMLSADAHLLVSFHCLFGVKEWLPLVVPRLVSIEARKWKGLYTSPNVRSVYTRLTNWQVNAHNRGVDCVHALYVAVICNNNFSPVSQCVLIIRSVSRMSPPTWVVHSKCVYVSCLLMPLV